MEFTEEAIYTVRKLEHVRTLHGVDLAWLKCAFDLRGEAGRLRAELRFFWENRGPVVFVR